MALVVAQDPGEAAPQVCGVPDGCEEAVLLVLDRIWNPPGGEGGNRRAAGKGFKDDVGKVVLRERGSKYVACSQQAAEFLFFTNATDIDRGETEVNTGQCILRRAEYDDSGRIRAALNL